jgi:putative hydrolase of the HAD superfamily
MTRSMIVLDECEVVYLGISCSRRERIKMTKPIAAYKGVFFDAGDTLITIPAAHEIMRTYLQDQDFHVEPVRLEGLLKESIDHFYTNKSNYTDEVCTPDSDRQFWVTIYEFIMNKLEAYYIWSEDRIHRCCHEMYDVFVDAKHYSLFEDVTACLTALSNRGQRLGVISNFAPTLRSILEQKGIAPYLDPIIVSTEVGLEKPNPAIFTLALQRANLEAKDVLFIGDHISNDVWAPQQIGMDAIRIVRYEGVQTTPLQMNEIRSLRELYE